MSPRRTVAAAHVPEPNVSAADRDIEWPNFTTSRGENRTLTPFAYFQ